MSGEANIWNPSTVTEVSADTKAVEERQVAAEGQTLITLSSFVYSLGTGALSVYKNGALLSKNVDWIEQTTNSFQIVAALTAGDVIVAVGLTAITGDVDVRDTDIFLANYQALRDYAGTEVTIYVQGTVTPADGGEFFFQYLDGEAPGTYVDDNDITIVPTAGDGSAGWIRTPRTLSDGDVTTAKIANGAVTLAKQADVATARIMGRVTAAVGVQEALTLAQVKTFLALTDASAAEMEAGTEVVTRAMSPKRVGQAIAALQVYAPDKSQWPTVELDADTDHDILFINGKILDSTGTQIITTGNMVKRIDAAWVAGNTSGGLFSGTVAADTTYHLFLIVKDDDGSVDAGFDTSLSAANIPAGYTAYRRIASILTEASANILGFIQIGDTFLYTAGRIQDVNDSSPGTANVTTLLTLPTGLKLIAKIASYLNKSSGANVLIAAVGTTMGTVSASNMSMAVNGNSTNASIELEVPTDASAQIKYKSDSGTLGAFKILTIGYIDERLD